MNEQKEKILKQVSNPSCSEDILIKASDDNENYSSSRIRCAVALNKNTPKSIIDKLLKDEYRWVRQAASANELVKKEEIAELVKNGDRYILKGLLNNPNTSEGIKTEITEMLKDEEKFPIETDTYIIENYCNEYVGGSMTAEEMAAEIVNGNNEKEFGMFAKYDDNKKYNPSSSLRGYWYNYDNLYHKFGDYNIIDKEILLPDGNYEPLNIKPESKITDCAEDFVLFEQSSDLGGVDGECENYEIELEGVFDSTKVSVNEDDYGLINGQLGFEYDGAFFNSPLSDDGSQGISKRAELNGINFEDYIAEYPDRSIDAFLTIQIKTDSGYKDFYIEDEISVMEENDVDVSDAEAVLKYLKETYGL